MNDEDIKKGVVSVLPQSLGAYVLAVTDTAARFKIPDRLAGKIATVQIDGTDCDVLAGGVAVACTYGQVATVDGSTRVITPHAESGIHLEDGQPRKVQFPPKAVAEYFSVDCKGSGSGNLYITID